MAAGADAVAAGEHAPGGVFITSETRDRAVIEAVLTASRTLVALAEPSWGGADDTTSAQYRALACWRSAGPLRMVDLARALEATRRRSGGCATGCCARG